jgi:hypothetical protein
MNNNGMNGTPVPGEVLAAACLRLCGDGAQR